MIKIIHYKTINQSEIDLMMEAIAKEFEIPISKANTSTTDSNIDGCWIAKHNAEIVGTIGILKIDTNCAVLKKMFVKKNFRGKEFSVSKLLLRKVFDWCLTNNIDTVFLGTMAQFIAAHKFYEKNGFLRISKSELPSGFINNPIDDIFYKINL